MKILAPMGYANNTSEEAVQQAIADLKATIYKDATQIRENFNKTLDMINNFYKDKD
jgi:hypothetical protein